MRRAAEPNIGFGLAAAEVGGAVGSFGTGFGSLGMGVFDLFKGVGSGIAQLFNPLFTLRDLIYGPQAGQQPAPTQQNTQGVMEAPPTSNMMTSPPSMIQKISEAGPTIQKAYQQYAPSYNYYNPTQLLANLQSRATKQIAPITAYKGYNYQVAASTILAGQIIR